MSQSGVHVIEAHHVSARDRLIASLRHEQFRWLYISNIAFMFAMMAQFLVRSLLAYDLTNDNAFALGIVNFVVAIPMLVISPLGGAVADRVDRRKLILFVQTAVLVDEAFVFLLLITDQLTFPYLLVLTGILGALFPFMMPARQAIIANVVGRQGLGNAMALQMGGMNFTRIVGPVAAGLLIPFIGIPNTWAVALVLYGVGLVAMLRGFPLLIPMRSRSAAPCSATWPMASAGFGATRPCGCCSSWAWCRHCSRCRSRPSLWCLPLDVWDAGESGLGILNAAAGIGGLLGSVYVAWVGESHKRLRLMMASILAFGATLIFFSLSPWFLLALPLILLADIFVTIFMVLNNTAIQVLIPDFVRGRVMSLLMMSFGLTPLATLPISWLAEQYGADIVVALASALMLVFAVFFFVLSPALRRIETSTREAEVEFGEAERRGRRNPELTPAAK